MLKQPAFIFSDEPKYRIQRHLSFWIFWWLFLAILYSFLPVLMGVDFWFRFQVSLLNSFLYMSCHIFLTYSLMYFVIPRYLVKGKYLATAIWVIILFIATAAMSTFINMVIADKVRAFLIPSYDRIYPHYAQNENVFLSLLAGLRGGITIGGLGAAIKLMKYWYIKEQRNLQLQKEKVEAQLQLLKAQIHPHFLFNTLNNIYSHTQDSSPVASKLVMGLSDMLRFMLYECNQPLVPLSKELKMLNDYISLEQIRYDEQFDVHVDLPGRTNHLAIAPVLLLPLVENCFKHGTSHMIEQPWMSLHIFLKGNVMHMKLMNGKVSDKRKISATGIGINNVKQRLELLYPNKYELDIADTGDVYIVKLSLELEMINAVKKRESNFILSYSD